MKNLFIRFEVKVTWLLQIQLCENFTHTLHHKIDNTEILKHLLCTGMV